MDVFAQYGETSNDKKGKLLYNIPKYLLWENDENITAIYIGIINSDPELLKSIRKEAKKPYPGAGTKVIVRDYISVQEAANDSELNLLYIPYSGDFRKAMEAFKNRPVALVSDNYMDPKSIMINFFDEKSGQISFKYSSANLRNVGISVHENLTKDLHGEDISKDDIINDRETRLRNTQSELSKKDKDLAEKVRLINEKEREIFDKERTIEKQNLAIQRQTESINIQAEKLRQQHLEMEALQGQQALMREELEQSEELLAAKNNEMAEVAAELQKQRGELVKQQQIAEEQLKRIEEINDQIKEKESELTALGIQNELLNHRLVIAWIAIIVFLLMLFFIAKLYIGKRKDNKKLEEQNIAIKKANDEISKQNTEISKQKEEIATQNSKIIESIKYAQNIQRAVMPHEEYFNQYLPDHFILLLPKDIVSGDFYWSTHVGNKFVYTAADCTGHGVPGAFMSLLGIAFLNEITGRMNPETITAGEILTQLREHVMTYLGQSGKEDEQKDGMDMALCIYDRESSTIQYAGANNPLLIYRGNELIQIDADEMPIGYYAGQTDHFTNHVMEVQMGDMTYMFSDGYADQFGMVNGRKKKYLIKRFRDFLMEIHELGMEVQKQRLDENLRTWRGDIKQLDDVCVLGVRF
ncbi:MAG: YfiR/HmsC family protein [Bacteroidales bacterium]|nr:YfiR/HmsC family protein [Bacteroidales bacterium]